MHNSNKITDTDTILINEQCEQQNATSKEQIHGFTRAYKLAKTIAHDDEKIAQIATQETIRRLILHFGELIEKRNQKGFRKTQVRFKNYSTALAPQLIPRAIESFSGTYADFLINPVEDDERLSATILYKLFEEIHPFEDGNGRVGDLLWKIAMTRVQRTWPQTLPPNIFDEQ